MVSVEATQRAPQSAADLAAESARVTSRRWALPLMVLAAIFVLSFGARLLAHDLVITADEDNWMRRAGGFTFGLLNGQLGRTYQNGHPGVTTMWVAMLTLGPERMVQYADRVHGQRLVGRVPGFWDALVDARPGFALVTALLVTLIAGLAWRLFGALVGGLTGLIVGLEPFLLGISQLVHMDAILSGCMVASVLMALVAWTRDGGRGWLVGSGILAGLAILSKVPAVYLLAFVPALSAGLWLLRMAPTRQPSAYHGAPSSPRHPPCAGEGEQVSVVVLDQPRFWLPNVSATFHGRDLFGPVAAHLAQGVSLTHVGSPGGAIQMIPFPATRRDLNAHGQIVAVHGEIVHVDRYGNLITSLAAADLPSDPVVEIAGRRIEGLAPHFQLGMGAVIALLGSSGLLEIAVPNGNAASVLGVDVGATVTVTTRR